MPDTLNKASQLAEKKAASTTGLPMQTVVTPSDLNDWES